MFTDSALALLRRSMTGEIARHDKVDVSLSLSDLEFDTKEVKTFDQMPGATPPTSGVAAQSVELGQRVKRNGQRFFQRKCAWRASRDEILVLTYERPLTQREDRRFVPTGGWELKARDSYRVHGVPLRRKGALSADPEQPHSVASDDMISDVNPDFTDGARALAVLPRLTRQSVLATVPEPFFFHGNILRYPSGNCFTVELLRMGKEKAVVINAVYTVGGNWQITQVTYATGELLQLPVKR